MSKSASSPSPPRSLRSFAYFAEDAARVWRSHGGGPVRAALRTAADPSLWALGLLRAGTAARALCGSSLGTRTLLRLGFHIDVWSDDIGPGLRLPHPFNIVLGEGARLGSGCTLLHNVTVQRGQYTLIGDRAFLGTGTVVLAGAHVGEGALVGAGSIVTRPVAPHMVAAGSPARALRAVRADERAVGR